MTIESEIHHQDITLPQSNKQPSFVDRKKRNECLSCRLIGTGALGGVGSYALWQSRATAPGSLGQKRVVAGLGVGQKFTLLPGTVTVDDGVSLALLIGGVFRWFQCKLLRTCLIKLFFIPMAKQNTVAGWTVLKFMRNRIFMNEWSWPFSFLRRQPYLVRCPSVNSAWRKVQLRLTLLLIVGCKETMESPALETQALSEGQLVGFPSWGMSAKLAYHKLFTYLH